MTTSDFKILIFHSSAKEDLNLLDQLTKHLKPLEQKQENTIQFWDERKIDPGSVRQEEIDEHLNSANIIILLISSDFLNSAIYNDKIKYELEQYNSDELSVIPVLLRASLWENSAFAKLQVLPKDENPIASSDNQDEAFKDVAQEIGKVIDEKMSSYLDGKSNKDEEIVQPRNRLGKSFKNHQVQIKKDRKITLLTSSIATIVITIVVLVIRAMGLLQWWELKAYDFMLVNRPPEKLDKRLLIIMVDQESNDPEQKKENFLPEAKLKKLLQKLQQDYKPRLIGLNFRQRESPYLLKAMENDNIVVVCATQRIDGKPDVEYLPPKELKEDPLKPQVGWANLFADTEDGVNRRWASEQYKPSLKQESEKCQAPYSLGLLMAFKYLQKQQNISVIRKKTERDIDELQLGNIKLASMQEGEGGYSEKMAKGEMLIHYRAGSWNEKKGQVAPILTLSQVMNNQVSARRIKEFQRRIILVGGNINDLHATPYEQEVSGVIIHAHITSQLLSAVLDQRPLLRGVPWWIGHIGVAVAAIVAGALFWWQRYRWRLVIINALWIVMIVAICYGFLWGGLWLPVVAPIVAVILTTAGLVVCQMRTSS